MKDSYVLHGDTYVPEHLLKKKSREMRLKFDLHYDEIPPTLRATEEDVAASSGARDPSWLEKNLRWRGCPVAEPFRFPLWIRCSNQATDTGYCKPHKMVPDRRAVSDDV